jgi:hypothetical protein
MFYFLSITIYYNHLKLNKDILIKLYHIKIHNLKNPFGNLLFNFYKSFIIFFTKLDNIMQHLTQLYKIVDNSSKLYKTIR